MLSIIIVIVHGINSSNTMLVVLYLLFICVIIFSGLKAISGLKTFKSDLFNRYQMFVKL